LKLFFRLIFLIFPASLSKSFPCFAGCKCKKLFLFPQAFSNLFFGNFFPLRFLFPAGMSKSVFAVAGAKVEPFSAYPSFFIRFFKPFSKLFLNMLATDCLRFDDFQIRVGFF